MRPTPPPAALATPSGAALDTGRLLRRTALLRFVHGYIPRCRSRASHPVALRRICQQLGVRGIRREKLKDAKSLLVNAPADPIIILNSDQDLREKPFTNWERFLIAHEVGHLILHQRGAKPPSGRSEYWKLENLCDSFACQLLIPDEILDEIANSFRCQAVDRLKATLFIAAKCHVPWSAAALRMSDSYPDGAFFRLTEMPNDGFKVVVSTCPNRQGIGQRIKPGSLLCHALEGAIKSSGESQEIEADKLCGIAGIKKIRSGAG